MTSKLKLLIASAVIPAVFLNAVPAMAAGTTQGTSVLNNVTVDFQVGGVAQTQASASDTFVVDRKILFNITEKATTGTTTVIPGQTARVTTFLLTNDANDTLDFTVTPANIVGGTAAHGGTDAFDVTSLLICLDGPVIDGVCDTAAAASLTINDLSGVTGNNTATILILGNIPAGATNSQVANVSATATALNSNGSAITGAGAAAADATVNGAGTVETIFADVAKSGNGGTSIARDGIDVATDDYTVSAAALSVFKSSRIISDGVSTSNFKAIPGAVVEYCISVTNAAGAASATNIAVRDIVPSNLTFSPGTIFVDATVTSPGASQTCAAGTGVTDATDADAGQYNTGLTRAEGTLSTIAASSSRALIFRAVIN
jgi:uncharacterized repeat protein (TIGR01451 family)